MAGLARAQQLFNRAILAPIAALIALGGSREAAQALTGANKGHGHPLLAKLIKSNAPNANAPGYRYPGYGHRPGKGATLLPIGTSTKPEQWRTQ